MKKLLSVALVIVMMMSMSISAFAEEVRLTETDNSVNIPIYGLVDSDGDTIPDGEDKTDDREVVIGVDVTWDDMTFTYTRAGRVWDPDTMTYNEVEGKWLDNETKDVTISNRSNVALNYYGSFKAIDGVEGFDVYYNEDNDYGSILPAATAGTDGNNGTAYTATLSFYVMGGSTYEPTEDTAAVSLGNFTLEIYRTRIDSTFDLKNTTTHEPTDGIYGPFEANVSNGGTYTIKNSEDITATGNVKFYTDYDMKEELPADVVSQLVSTNETDDGLELTFTRVEDYFLNLFMVVEVTGTTDNTPVAFYVTVLP